MHPNHTTQQLKTCTKCRRELPASGEFFYAYRRAKDGLQYRCKKCQSAESKAWYRDRAEELKDRRRENFERWYRANRRRNLAANKAWRDANREKRSEYMRAYRRANHAIYRAADNRRRLAKMSAHGSHTAKDIRERLEEQAWMCAYCHEPLGDGYHVDHIVPLSRGGGDGPDNLAIACPACNQSKGSKLLDEWKGTGKLEEAS